MNAVLMIWNLWKKRNAKQSLMNEMLNENDKREKKKFYEKKNLHNCIVFVSKRIIEKKIEKINK